MANKHFVNGVIKSEPKSWAKEEIDYLLLKKKEGFSFDFIRPAETGSVTAPNTIGLSFIRFAMACVDGVLRGIIRS